MVRYTCLLRLTRFVLVSSRIWAALASPWFQESIMRQQEKSKVKSRETSASASLSDSSSSPSSSLLSSPCSHNQRNQADVKGSANFQGKTGSLPRFPA